MGCHCLPQGIFLTQGRSLSPPALPPALQADALPSEPPGKLLNSFYCAQYFQRLGCLECFFAARRFEAWCRSRPNSAAGRFPARLPERARMGDSLGVRPRSRWWPWAQEPWRGTRERGAGRAPLAGKTFCTAGWPRRCGFRDLRSASRSLPRPGPGGAAAKLWA